MEDKKELTKDLLTASFRELVLQIPFEKITIKMITDGAGVIRPTFYKHFQYIHKFRFSLPNWITPQNATLFLNYNQHKTRTLNLF